MSKKKIYMAGPITGLKYDDAESWRYYVKMKGDVLSKGEIEWFSPLRQQEHLREAGILQANHDDENPMTSANGLMTRDFWDVKTCNAVFCNLLNAQRVSIGSVMELGFAYSLHKPVILMMEKDGNLHEHSMINNSWVFRVDTLDKGIQLCCDILLP